MSIFSCNLRFNPEPERRHFGDAIFPGRHPVITGCRYPGGGGGVLGPKIAGGVPLATENWIQKGRGKNGILGPKRSNFARICTQKIVFVLVDEKKHPKKIEFGIQSRGSKKGVKTAAHMYQPS